MLLVDANVLIDFAGSDMRVLALAGQHLGPVHVARDVLDEVDQLDEHTCHTLGILVVDIDVSTATQLANRRGALSFQDHVCLHLAVTKDWTCVTNDRALRTACEQQSIEVLWGLQLLLQLVDVGALEAASAANIGTKIAEKNPWLADSVLRRFLARLDSP